MRLILARPLLALALALTPLGCAKTISHVMQGEAYSTGTPAYDDFFTSLKSAQDDAKAMESEALASRAPLITVLGLEPTAADAVVVREAEQRVKKLKEGGVLLHLEILPEARVLSTKDRKSIELTGQDLLKGAEESTRSTLSLGKRMSVLALKAAELEKARSELRAQAPQTFRGEPQAKRDEIIAELDAAQTVLAAVLDGSTRQAGLSAKYLLDLAVAMETGAAVLGPLDTPPKPPNRWAKSGASPKPPAPPSVAAASPPPAAKKPADPPPPAAKPPPPATPPPAAPPPKKKPPKGGDDFEP